MSPSLTYSEFGLVLDLNRLPPSLFSSPIYNTKQKQIYLKCLPPPYHFVILLIFFRVICFCENRFPSTILVNFGWRRCDIHRSKPFCKSHNDTWNYQRMKLAVTTTTNQTSSTNIHLHHFLASFIIMSLACQCHCFLAPRPFNTASHYALI